MAGRKGTGKSHLLQSIVLQHARTFPGSRWVVWDTTREWAEPEWARGRIEVFGADEWPDVEEVAEHALGVAEDLGGCVLVVDEVDRVAPNHGGGLREGTALHRIVHYGRHHDAALVCASRRSARVHADIPSLADTAFLFRHTGHLDLAWIQRFFGPEAAEAVSNLQPREWLRIDLDRD